MYLCKLSDENTVYVVNSAYNFTNALIFMIIGFTLMVGVRVRRIFLEPDVKRRVSSVYT